MKSTLVDRAAGFLDARMSRRSVFVRSAFVGSAVAAGGVDFLVKPGTAYGVICACGSHDCGCGSACCDGFTEFCCTINGGYNYCPSNSVMGGWWKADGSAFCAGPRYYMDCNATCGCDTGCGGGWPFCEPECDGVDCGCAEDNCAQRVTGCFQFRYGQCNQDVPCMGRIVCRVVSCVAPWEIDPTCTTTNAQDNFTATQNAPCNTAVPIPRPVGVAITATPSGAGYWLAASDGGIFTFGDARFFGSTGATAIARPVVGMAATPTGAGYWLVASDGGIFTFGDAAFFGSTGGIALHRPIVAMAATPSGAGYWLVASDGGIFTFGDAAFFGSTGSVVLDRPIVDMAATKTGSGYWLVAADGGIFAFGDAAFLGSTGAVVLDRPIVGMAATKTGSGYWLVASDGGIFTFGDAAFLGSTGGLVLDQPVVAMAATKTGAGYWLTAADDGIFTFGDAVFLGSEA
jgi:hypothetical protein